HENFIKARDYIFANSDDINRAWLRYNFEDQNTGEFMDALAKYQYPDGGFGRLVPEFVYDGSTLHDTEHAFRYIFYLNEKPSANHPVIQRMMRYLLDRYRPEIGSWGEELEPGVNDGVHVSWWTYGKHKHPAIPDIDERIKKYDPNGNAAHAAFVALYSELVPDELYKDIIFYPIEHILRYYDEKSPLFENPDDEPYGLHCYQKFVVCLKDRTIAEKLAACLCQHPTACMQLDFMKWEKGYEHLPCHVVETPDSMIYPAVKYLVDKSLSYLIRQQGDDGAWHLNYRFGEDEVFRKLETDFEAHQTMLLLAELGRFGRIEI
ncbi:MAG TPA: hypothetical protein DEP23_02185, partial [Ruminococcaceae bacterium]|nr:hypothetical protein [Oscillospiraceae bacterium]